MKTYTFKETNRLLQRARRVIPGGIYGHMSPRYYVPDSDYPLYAVRAEGARFWDPDGNEFIDYMCAYGPMALGYNHPKVDEAALQALKNANTVTTPSPVMVELAEFLVELVPAADWAVFAKNGNDVTSLSLMVARAATGRDKIVLVEGSYHGAAPWAQRPGRPGTVDGDHSNILYTRWNDYQGLERLVAEHRHDIAGFLSTPYFHPTSADSQLPGEDYWAKVEALCRREGIVLIIDDVRCGFRLDMRGSHEYFGFTPDLVCFSKAIANGYPLSALVGSDSLKSECEKVFATGSFWFSSVPMAAALATLRELQRIDGPRVMQQIGGRLRKGLEQIAESHGFDLRVTGVPSMPFVRVAADKGAEVQPELHQRWCGECTKRGVFFASHHNWFLSTAHTDRELERTLDIVDEAFRSLSSG